MQTHYRLREQISPYQLTVQVLSPPQSLVEDTGLVITATDGTAIRESLYCVLYCGNSVAIAFCLITGGSDYSVVTGPLNLMSLTPTNQQTTTAVTIIRDGIVLEEEETFSLQLQQTSGQQPVVAVQNTTVTIVDGDGECEVHHCRLTVTCGCGLQC